MSLLQVQNLVCGYDGKEVIKGISFGIATGEMVGIIGPNGSGKTTLFKAITKILKSYKGSIVFNEKNIFETSFKELAREIASLPQSLYVPFSFSVEEFVLMGRFPHLKRMEKMRKEDIDIAESAMESLDVLSLRSRAIHELSGGERQRVFLAQALTQMPKLLLLDEPTTHLDISHQIEILSLIRKLSKERKLTVLMILHDLNLAGEYCERLILIADGKVQKTGRPEEVLTYQIIEEVYKTVVVVKENPITKKPYVIPVPDFVRD